MILFQVLSNVRETMSRREWLQVSHNVRVASASIAAVRRQCLTLHERVLQGICRRLLASPEATIRHQESPGQSCLSGLHCRSESHTHERHFLVEPNGVCQVSRTFGKMCRRRNGKRFLFIN